MPSVTGTSTVAKTTTGSGSSLTYSHTSNGDPLFVSAVRFSSGGNQTITAVTFGGVALTKVAAAVDSNSSDWWWLAAPVAGTANIVITTVGGSWIASGARNVNLSDLTGAPRFRFASANASSTAPSVTITSEVGGLVLDAVYSDSNNQVFTVGAGQTQQFAQNSIANTDSKTAGSSEAGAASVTMSWTLSISDAWSISALSITQMPTGMQILQKSTKYFNQFGGPPLNLTPFAMSPTVGNAIVVVVAQNDTSFLPTAVSDNFGNEWYLAAQGFNAAINDAVAIFVCPKLTAVGFNYTISVIEQSNCLHAQAFEIIVPSGSWLGIDRTITATGNSAVPATGTTAALRGSTCLAFAGVCGPTTLTSITVESVSPAWVQEWENLTGGSSNTICECDSRTLPTAAGTTTSASWALSASMQWATTLAVFASGLELPPVETRITQDVVETLSQSVAPETRVGQYVVEVLTGAPPAKGWVTQVVVETLTSSDIPGPGGFTPSVFMGDMAGNIWVE